MAADDDQPCRLGVLAFGDSITNGGGELQWGVALQSWALWTARALGMPYTGYARDGARTADIARDQLAAFAADARRGRSGPMGGAAAGERYDVGAVYAGVNDVRALDWDADAFARDHARVLATLRERCERVLAVAIPLDLGRPRAGHVEEGNAVILANARAAGALVLDLRGFRGRELVMADHVHPTAFGQLAIAERALAVLAADGLAAPRSPRELVAYETTGAGRLRGDATYAYRHAKISARAAWIRARSGRARRAA
jgi:lysophospholipase L1-like esterase